MTKEWILSVGANPYPREEGMTWDAMVSLGAEGITGWDAEFSITISNEDMPRFIERLQESVLKLRAKYENENKEEEDAPEAS